jgi:hypothetical protein
MISVSAHAVRSLPRLKIEKIDVGIRHRRESLSGKL